ncbi:5-methyltetrahydropteroyltriglutamate--homocysteine methyltransferase [Natronomonas marina]|jgi:5-methyltetrahydropteroyltriglutamate--homocysteine methyltransferase|uniref:5-methyltetrahydropteroyltriglutamate-- homocysteine methyltransferase n=1 Tax=Natronomonas marina TaxID=2961939 RepID=UPI0020C9580E|nr:5-methyltetrahydropteroyltriglutamate--homocysteine methyltransferase [Natronomonas marina]
MTEVIATTPGLFPLPDWAKEELSDLKGHQKDDLISGDEGEAVLEAYDRARNEVVETQEAAGLDRIVEGQLRWDDMLAHPLVVHDNVETRGIVRYYDNNNFYREPVVTGELSYDGDVAAELDAAGAVDQAVLPGPYSLSELATDEHYGDEAAFLDGVAEFLAGETEALPEVETLFLLEPSLVTDPPGDGEDRRASAAIDRVAAAADADTDVVVHTYWGAIPEKPYAHLMDADVDAIGFDFVNDHEENVYNIQEYGTKESIAVGVVDGQNTLVETPAEIAERVEWVEENVPAQSFETVYATANTELFYLPVNRFEAKLEALAAAPAEVSR